MFSNGCSAWIWSRLWSLILDLVPAPCCEPGPLWSHRNSFSLYIVCFPSPGIFIPMRYNIYLSCILILRWCRCERHKNNHCFSSFFSAFTTAPSYNIAVKMIKSEHMYSQNSSFFTPQQVLWKCISPRL